MKKVALLSVALCAALLCPAERAAAVPAGYVVEVVSGGLINAVSFDFAPDGRIFVNELTTGRIRIIENGVLLPAAFAQVSVNTNGERGLLGIALHPDFAVNGWVYICFSKSTGGHEIGRFTAVGNTGTDYTPIVTNLPSAVIHNGGNIAFGPDGKLYHTMGENGSPSQAQNVNSYPGKIHRFNDDGTVPADNPYPSGLLSRYCMGLRNSFDLCWNHDLQILYASENGPNANDEANLIAAGLNYGWPTVQCQGPGFEPALTCWTPTIAPTGITAYTGDNFESIYLNDLFMGDFNTGRIWRLNLTADGTGFINREVFHDDTVVYDVVCAPDGYLYYCTNSQLKRIRRLIPVTPPDGLTCDVVADEDVALAWVNNGGGAGGEYEEIQVRRDADVIATLAGDATGYTDIDPPGGDRNYEVRGVESGNVSDPATCQATLPLDPPSNLVCTVVGDTVELTWVNEDIYSSVIIRRNGVLLGSVLGGQTSFIDNNPPAGLVDYEVAGALGTVVTEPATCQVFLPIPFVRGDCNGDGVIDLADPIGLLEFVSGGGGGMIDCDDACDMNDDEVIDIADPVAILNYLFLQGPGSDECVTDADPALDCVDYAHCP